MSKHTMTVHTTAGDFTYESEFSISVYRLPVTFLEEIATALDLPGLPGMVSLSTRNEDKRIWDETSDLPESVFRVSGAFYLRRGVPYVSQDGVQGVDYTKTTAERVSYTLTSDYRRAA